MRSITTAAAFAIAASLAAGQDFPTYQPTRAGKSSKSGECTSCSADTLTRANLMTNLAFDYWSNEGVIDSASIEETCAATDALQEAEFAQALEYTAGCVVSPTKCFVDFLNQFVIFGNQTVSEGEFLSDITSYLCYFEAIGGGGTAPEEFCASINPCNGGGPPFPPAINALAPEDGDKHDLKSHLLEAFFGRPN